MPKILNLIGNRYGKLVVIGKDEEKSKTMGYSYWICKCDCGREVSVRGGSLTFGHTKSCGCVSREKTIKRSTKHGLYYTRLHQIWIAMRQRCNDKNAQRYCDYGGRGIKVCTEWDDFINFYNWSMVNGYTDELTIDRIDVNSDYEPSNCRWVDNTVQANNKRNNVTLTINNETHSIADWYRILKPNVNLSAIYGRYHKEGFQSVEQLFRDKAS
jgi:hypothetical protein